MLYLDVIKRGAEHIQAAISDGGELETTTTSAVACCAVKKRATLRATGWLGDGDDGTPDYRRIAVEIHLHQSAGCKVSVVHLDSRA